MQEIGWQVAAYLRASPLVNLLIAFVSGFVAIKTTAQERRPTIVLSFVVGVVGFFLSEFVLAYFGLAEHVGKLFGLRIFIDLLAAYIGAFVIASAIHFFKPL